MSHRLGLDTTAATPSDSRRPLASDGGGDGEAGAATTTGHGESIAHSTTSIGDSGTVASSSVGKASASSTTGTASTTIVPLTKETSSGDAGLTAAASSSRPSAAGEHGAEHGMAPTGTTPPTSRVSGGTPRSSLPHANSSFTAAERSVPVDIVPVQHARGAHAGTVGGPGGNGAGDGGDGGDGDGADGADGEGTGEPEGHLTDLERRQRLWATAKPVTQDDIDSERIRDDGTVLDEFFGVRE